MAKHKKKKKTYKKSLPIRPPVVLPFETKIPIEIIKAAVHKAFGEYKRG